MNVRIKELLLLLLLGLIFISCKSKNTIDEEDFAKLYYNILVTQEKFKADSTLLKKEQDKVFKKFGVTEKQYYSTLDAYNKDPERWRTVFENLKTYQEPKPKKITKH